MTPQQFQKLFEARLSGIKRYAKQDLPRHIGKLGVDHYQENFMLGATWIKNYCPGHLAKEFDRIKAPLRDMGLCFHRAKNYLTQ